MKLEQSFEVAAPVDRVWQALIDVEHVAPCLPGAAVTGRNEDGSYNGTFTIKIGPTTASYTGKLEMQDVNEVAHTATLHAQGTDKRGQGGANATIVSRVAKAGEGTRVEVNTDYHITGRLARFGRGGMIEDISERLLKEFAARLQSSLAAPVQDAAAAEAEAPAPTEAPAPAPTDAPAPVDGSSPEGDEAVAPPPPPGVAEPPPPDVATPGPPPPPPPGSPPPPPPAPPRPPRPEAAEPLQAHHVLGGVLVDRFRRNPAPVIAAAAVLLLIRRRRRRRKRAESLT